MLPLYLLVSPVTSHRVRFHPSVVVPCLSCQPNEHDASICVDAFVGSFACVGLVVALFSVDFFPLFFLRLVLRLFASFAPYLWR